MTGAAIMVAPNGGRRAKSAHPALPVTIAEMTGCAVACQAAGADAIHVHLRDRDGQHLLDAGAYREQIADIEAAAPSLAIQITTEAVGLYSAAQQMQLVRALRPRAASCALRELAGDAGGAAEARRFFHDCRSDNIGIQHILYDPAEVRQIAALVADGTVPSEGLSLLFVVGRYPDGGGAAARMLLPFLAELQAQRLTGRWMACGFGRQEPGVLAIAMAAGGHARVGFENNLHNADGSLACDNAQRVAKIARLRASLALAAPDPATTAAVLGMP